MTSPADSSNHVVEAYLDGQLDEADRLRFERQAMRRPELRAELDRQRAIDGSLRRLMQPPDDARLEAIVDAACRRAEPARRPRRLRRGFAIAAGLAAAVTGSWLAWHAVDSRLDRGGYVAPPQTTLAAVWREADRGTQEPIWRCETDEEFSGTFRRRFGRGLLLHEPPAGVEALGLSYAHTLSPRTTCLVGRAGEATVVVFVDRVGRDDRPGLPPGSDLHLFRRVLGRLVLYEVSPLDEPVLLDLFYHPGDDTADESRAETPP